MLGFDPFTFDPKILGGRACIRGMRVSVALVLNLAANGMTPEEIVDASLPGGRGCPPGAVLRCVAGR